MNMRSAAWRLARYGAAWLILSEGAAPALLPLVVIVSAAAASQLLHAPGTWRWSVSGFVRFVPFFVYQSFAGGVDVARRALHPRLPIAPAMLDYRVRLPDGPARRFFLAVTGLLPGTLAARAEPDRITLHVLNRDLPLMRTVRALEDRTADLFGVVLPDGQRRL